MTATIYSPPPSIHMPVIIIYTHTPSRWMTSTAKPFFIPPLSTRTRLYLSLYIVYAGTKCDVNVLRWRFRQVKLDQSPTDPFKNSIGPSSLYIAQCLHQYYLTLVAFLDFRALLTSRDWEKPRFLLTVIHIS